MKPRHGQVAPTRRFFTMHARSLAALLVLMVVPFLGPEAQRFQLGAYPPGIVDSIGARLADLELRRLQLKSKGISAPHASVTELDEGISALHRLIAELPDSLHAPTEVNRRLADALAARLVSVTISARLTPHGMSATSPQIAALLREELLLRERLDELGAQSTRDPGSAAP